jgi:hypothetical protein
MPHRRSPSHRSHADIVDTREIPLAEYSAVKARASPVAPLPVAEVAVWELLSQPGLAYGQRRGEMTLMQAACPPPETHP